MRSHLIAVGVSLGLLAGCSGSGPQGLQQKAAALAPGQHSSKAPAMLAHHSVANLPDRGALVAYDQALKPRHVGSATWYPVQLSEDHAIASIATGELDLPAPDGHPIRVKYSRHVEHADGNWTWVGKVAGAGAEEAVLTFGQDAVFGSIPTGNGAPLQLTMLHGKTYLVQADAGQLVAADPVGGDSDFAVPLMSAATARAKVAASHAMQASASHKVQTLSMPMEAGAVAPVNIDVVIGYTPGLVTQLGSASAAVTRLNYLVDLTNQIYSASQVNAKLRMMQAVNVNYTSNNTNRAALFDLTGVTCTVDPAGTRLPDGGVNCTAATRPAALQPLIDARESTGADLVVLVRDYTVQRTSCGIAWLLGGGQQPITTDDADHAMSVVSDSSGSGTNTCRDEQMTHEMGHNMGLQHDALTASNGTDSNGDGNNLDPEEYGAYPYAFGYSAPANAGNFNTIMALQASAQSRFRVFSNPRLNSCNGFPCGIDGQADNALALSQTLPIIASFRAAVVDYDDVPNNYWSFEFVKRLTAAGITTGCSVSPPLFCPTQEVTRAQMAVFLLKGIHGGSYVPPAASSSFQDVPNSYWAATWIEELKNEGITSGCSTSPPMFCPDTVVDRATMAVLLLRAEHGTSYTPPPATGFFQDVPTSYWAAAWIEALAGEKITSGCSASPPLYCPESNVTRDQMAVFLTKTFAL